MVAAWKSILIEAERISQIHSTIKDNLCDNEIQQVKMFQKDNYRKVQIVNYSPTSSIICSKSRLIPIEFVC